MNDLERLIRKRLGQTRFNVIHPRRLRWTKINGEKIYTHAEHKHLNFDFNTNTQYNLKIMTSFLDFKFSYHNTDVWEPYTATGNFFRVFSFMNDIHEFLLLHDNILPVKEFHVHKSDRFGYKQLNNKLTVDIIKYIIENYSINYKEIIRNEKIENILLKNNINKKP